MHPPEPGETIADPACGTGGSLLVAHEFISQTYDLDRDEKRFLRDHTSAENEIVDNTARLCAMNLFLHGIGSSDPAPTPPIGVQDALPSKASDKDVVLANPPFGRRSSVTIVGADGKASRDAQTLAR